MTDPIAPRASTIISVPGAAHVDIQDPVRWAKTVTADGRVVVATATAATLVALVLVQRLSVTYLDGLAVTDASALLMSDSVEPIRMLADDLLGWR